MAVSYASPGVYVEEVERGIKPIQAVGTSMAAFIGLTAEASLKGVNPATGERVAVESRLNKPTLVTNWTQFTDIFGQFMPGAYLPDTVYGYFANGGGPCYVTSLRALKEFASPETGQPAEVTIPTKGRGNAFKVRAKQPGMTASQTITIAQTGEENFSMTVGEETRSGLTMKKGENYVGDTSFANVVVTDVGSAGSIPSEGSYTLSGVEMKVKPLTAVDFIGDPTERTGLGSIEALDEVRLILCPDIFAGYDGSDEAKQRVKMVQEALIAHCERQRYRFAILDTPPGLNAQQAKEWREYLNFDSSYAALYYPWIEVADLSGNGSTTRLVPPSGHVAGIYNRTDANRGVHKAPANDTVLGAVNLETLISKGEQDILNPIGVNCIRSFPGLGIRVWGARTLSSNGAWRYVSVRRLFIMVEASMDFRTFVGGV